MQNRRIICSTLTVGTTRTRLEAQRNRRPPPFDGSCYERAIDSKTPPGLSQVAGVPRLIDALPRPRQVGGLFLHRIYFDDENLMISPESSIVTRTKRFISLPPGRKTSLSNVST